MDDHGKTLYTIALDWLAAVLASGEGWAVKREAYAKGVTPELDPMFNWIDRSFTASGEMPSYETTKQRWSKQAWPVTPLNEAFAALELEQAYRRYELISHARELDRLLTEGTTNEAYEVAVGFNARALRHTTAHGLELTDPILFADRDVDMIALPSWGNVMAGRSIHRGDLVLVAARTQVGKSWILLMAALDAIRAGWDVVFYSLEMSAEQLAKRVRTLLGVDDVPAWLESQSGHLYVIDQTMSRRGFTASDLIRRIDQGSRTLAVVDYGELMRPDSGGRASEDWRKSAEVSQALQNVAKYVDIPLIAAVQDNRQAIGNKPGVETVSGSDQWGRDADTVVRLRDEVGEPVGCGPTRVLDQVKSRHTGVRYPTFFSFDPEGTGIRIIDHHEYVAINSKG